MPLRRNACARASDIFAQSGLSRGGWALRVAGCVSASATSTPSFFAATGTLGTPALPESPRAPRKSRARSKCTRVSPQPSCTKRPPSVVHSSYVWTRRAEASTQAGTRERRCRSTAPAEPICCPPQRQAPKGVVWKSSSTSRRSFLSHGAFLQCSAAKSPMHCRRSSGVLSSRIAVRASKVKYLPRCRERAASTCRARRVCLGMRQVDDSTTWHRGPAASMIRARRPTSTSLSAMSGADSSFEY
mmetsp:Transcript_47467/g.126738  ORF Transcript_47467/g.126738 Transcript_47467/m.126738 type:complete len:244 (+) Transcript_47467:108-839(+)